MHYIYCNRHDKNKVEGPDRYASVYCSSVLVGDRTTKQVGGGQQKWKYTCCKGSWDQRVLKSQKGIKQSKGTRQLKGRDAKLIPGKFGTPPKWR